MVISVSIPHLQITQGAVKLIQDKMENAKNVHLASHSLMANVNKSR